MARTEAAERREQIIRATYRAFVEKGSADVTLQDIADRAEFSKGVVMYYFPEGKEKVFVALLEWLVDNIGRSITTRVREAQGAEAKLRAMIDDVFANANASRRFYTIYLDFVAHGLRNPNFRATNVSFYEWCREINLEIIEAGIAEGIFRPVALEEASAVIRGILDGLGLQWLFEEVAAGQEEAVFARYRNWALSAILGYLEKR
jgi:AcrR family transcriptional regulator